MCLKSIPMIMYDAQQQGLKIFSHFGQNMLIKN